MVKQLRRDLGRIERPAADASQTGIVSPKIEPLGTGAFATVDLPTRHYRGYYEGFANSALWPALHSRPDLIQVTADDYASYREVNAFMARGLLRFSDPRRDLLGSGLSFPHARRRNAAAAESSARSASSCTRRGPSAARCLRCRTIADLVQAMLAYDLIGFQTEDDRQNFEDYLAGRAWASTWSTARSRRLAG